ncbi:MAG: hypothetical protein CM15mP106_4530 [Candidatus Neomarinimicrobiota bacterium]|nr:MAG: hypothetical protein CM15mP106_4530 [Candidatus Neomarinimicrobiota bacterium]
MTLLNDITGTVSMKNKTIWHHIEVDLKCGHLSYLQVAKLVNANETITIHELFG